MKAQHHPQFSNELIGYGWRPVQVGGWFAVLTACHPLSSRCLFSLWFSLFCSMNKHPCACVLCEMFYFIVKKHTKSRDLRVGKATPWVDIDVVVFFSKFEMETIVGGTKSPYLNLGVILEISSMRQQQKHIPLFFRSHNLVFFPKKIGLVHTVEPDDPNTIWRMSTNKSKWDYSFLQMSISL